MANWKKVVVSGSNAELNQLSLSSDLTALNISNSSSVADTQLTGSFTGSFVGDGSGLTGLATNLSISSAQDGDGAQTVDLLNDTLKFVGGDGISTSVDDNARVTITADDITQTIKAGRVGATGTAVTDLSHVLGGPQDLEFRGDGLLIQAQGGSEGNDPDTLTFSLDASQSFADLSVSGNTSVGGNLSITGNLDVNGTVTTIDSTNVLVEDKFILLSKATGSNGSTNSDGGIIVQTFLEDGQMSGTSFFYDDSSKRWAFTRPGGINQDDTTGDADQFVVSVETTDNAPDTTPSDFGNSDNTRVGMMHVNNATGEIYIYS